MIYKDFKDKKISWLGLGCMRFPTVNGDLGNVDMEKTAEIFDLAIKNGVNYFDTAWGYHNGQSEIVTGKILSKYPRESYFLADKFPGYDLANMDKVEEIFEQQLQKTGVEYFDFYLIHNVCEKNVNQYLDEKYRIFKHLVAQKEQGRIRHLGFSAHADLPDLKRFLDKYGYAMEFCQLQINWVDWEFQRAKEKVALLKEYNIPVWVMEPVRGGKLARLSPKHEERLKALRPNESVAAWCFRFLQTALDATVVLSGMSDLSQVADNLKTCAVEQPLTAEELQTLREITAEMMVDSTPCTACRYCTEYCPMGLNIPELLELYNEHKFSNGGFISPMRIGVLPEDKRPSACLGCRACESVCPQNIKISEELAAYAERLK